MSVEIFENDISIKKETAILAWTSTVHKVQDLSLQQGVIDFDLEKQKLAALLAWFSPSAKQLQVAQPMLLQDTLTN